MYNLPHHKDANSERIIEFIKQNPFAFIAGCNSKQEPVATQIPVFIEEREGKLFFKGHIMKGTDHYKAFLDNPEALLVFTSPHTYVSATWYDNPHQASTYNYMSVHVRGKMRFTSDEELIELLEQTSLHYEKGNKASSTVYSNLPDEYKLKLLNAIKGFEVEALHMDHVFKISQDRDGKSYSNIIEKLEGGNDSDKFISEEMKKRKDELYPGH